MGQMTSSALGMDDVLGPIENMQPPSLFYKSYFPLKVEVAKSEGLTKKNTNSYLDQSSAVTVIQPRPKIKIEAATEVLPAVAAVTIVTKTKVTNGINWDIQTDIDQ